jgi:DNA end-binding protein Ku
LEPGIEACGGGCLPSSPREGHMPRAIWTGTVSFGLVEIPVRLHSAVARGKEISFKQIDRRDMAPVGYDRVNRKTGKPVPWEEIIKGYEHKPGEYVVLSPKELERANVEATRTIDILDFVEAAEIAPVYFDTPYYLEPARPKSKSYVLLRETLRKSGKIAVCQVVLRERQHLAALTVRDAAIALVTLRYAYDVKDPSELTLPAASAKALGLTEREIGMAQNLVAGMTTKWKPERYQDRFRKDVLALVQKKVRAGQSHEVVESEAPEERKKTPSGEVLDLMPLLEQSLKKSPRSEVRVAGASAKRANRPATRRRKQA